MQMKIFSFLNLLKKKYSILIILCIVSFIITNYLIELRLDFKFSNYLSQLNNYRNLNEENSNFFDLNPTDRLCSNQNVTLLIMVAISIDKFSNRALLRATWYNKYLVSGLRVIFLVGMSSNSTLNEKIKEEFHMYHDIVRENFIDSYRNLTIKTIMGIKWASIYCSNAKFYMKSDDNILLNTYRLVKFLENNQNTNTFLCKPHYNAVVIRDIKSKFHVPKDVFKNDNYPTCKYK